MDSPKCYTSVLFLEMLTSTDSAKTTIYNREQSKIDVSLNALLDYPPSLQGEDPDRLLERIRSGQLWVVNGKRRNGLILCKEFHAEFAGPGAAVGSVFDLDCVRVIPVGDLSLVRPETHKDRQNAYLIRRQWIKLTQQSTDQSAPLQRAKMILTQFETYFDQGTIARVPDDVFAMMVGVLPYSVRMARRTPGKLNVKVKT